MSFLFMALATLALFILTVSVLILAIVFRKEDETSMVLMMITFALFCITLGCGAETYKVAKELDASIKR